MAVKRYLCIGDETLASIHLPRLYKVHPEVCDYTTELRLNGDMRKGTFLKLIWLRPKADGKYRLPDHSICKCGATMLWMVSASGKRTPVDCKHDIVGQKLFNSETMTSHFVTCPLAKQFRKNNKQPKAPTL